MSDGISNSRKPQSGLLPLVIAIVGRATLPADTAAVAQHVNSVLQDKFNKQHPRTPLAENGDWVLLHRERPLEPVRSMEG